ncbi:MAG: preprotein translocase subunit SecG [Chloroflexi bacterium]|nr:preprotein translocase subunit SecG [Chloroflexota bacterium]MCY3587411.1 preprotein translocase subunit SecG [Chloroflexota bacterium]MCY3685440.1 preprotein translocase subunit SecG [Chloroflexota bacterium]MDE2708342.1 preprotein translocase subunit SecG [Chloroflexota bacterium]MDE2988258.1 preprotein translocase subunit SecG [Chloroflexota bacterium]
MSTSELLNVIQILVALVVIAAVILQAKGAGLGNIFGGAGAESSYRTRRGLERTLFRGTIVLMLIFVGLSIAATQV